ncbi:MAG: hypothetical protein E6394_04730 [Veillonella sp.]|nr:hypothetical protein [Veillonella sp.]
MKFKCYDVVEIQGKRYVVGEVLSYQEFIVDKTIRYDLNDENYKKELGVSKGAQSLEVATKQIIKNIERFKRIRPLYFL